LRNSPKQDAFTAELAEVLPDLLSAHSGGQLALFTSRRQMEATYAALPEEIREMVLMQNTRSRQQILQVHRDRIEASEPSIIFGLQSMGEGLDLPGALCEHVLIDRLPFTPPTSPVEEALGEWLATQNRDAFNEISVPRTAMRLAQWVGRGVRSVHDHATITICDNRLSKTAYGRRILQGLPNFARAET
jgi:ATP-dependent DNA helicase DinG